VAEQLQVPRQSFGLGFSWKIQLSAGKDNKKHVPFGTFLEKEEVPAYRQLAGI
jgi:hypothetical protein